MYVNELIDQGITTREIADKVISEFAASLEDMLEDSKNLGKSKVTPFLSTTWKGIGYGSHKDMQASLDTGVSKTILKKIGKAITDLPEDKAFFKKIKKLMAERQKMIFESETLDWAMGETLAYATLVSEGFRVRISGQDVERGTFSHRHAILKIDHSEEEYIPLRTVEKNIGDFTIYNSLLSEYGVLGFEYGYAMASPNTLTIWEAQFGDFGNGAQIIMDQFLSAAEDKWKLRNGLVMLLPHGYEGQGAEHSSARIERYLNLCAEDNMVLANCTTPASFFHLLRRQMHRKFRKPLIVFTPKSLLRHPLAVSKLTELTKGGFKEIIDDVSVKAADVKKVLLCSGKIYYHLKMERDERKQVNVAIVRLEQIFPIAENQLKAIIKKYNKAESFVWVQEEPENMGAWGFMLRTIKDIKLEVVCRKASGSPASGSHKTFERRQKYIIDKALSV